MTMAQARRAATPNGKFGLYDEQDGLWLGTDAGPLRYDDEVVARLAAEITSRMVGWPVTRVRARVFDRTSTIRDSVRTIATAVQALREAESGRFW